MVWRIGLDVLGDFRLRLGDLAPVINLNPRLSVILDAASPVALHEQGVSRFTPHFALGHETQIPLYPETQNAQHVLWTAAGVTRFSSGGLWTLRGVFRYTPQSNDEICGGAEWQSLIDFRQLNLGLSARALYCHDSLQGSSASLGLGLITTFPF